MGAACLLLSLAACENTTGPSAAANAAIAGPAFSQGALPRPVTPALQSRTPVYPAIAVYIVYREWVNRHPDLTTLSLDDARYQRYVEKRLRELYPDRGYSGMMREAVAEARQNQAAWQQYEREMREYERRMGAQPVLPGYSIASSCGAAFVDPNAGQDVSWSGQEEFLVPPDSQLPTIQMEVDSLMLTGSQVDDIYYYETIAKGTYSTGGGSSGGGGGGGEPVLIESVGGSTDERIRAAALGYPDSGGEIGAQSLTAGAISVGLGLIGWKAYRAATAHQVARQKSTAFFALAESDTKRDAHRHIYWSMMLRRWIGETMAKAVTDWYENQANSVGPARVMDFHNNAIGRTHRYNSFRGHWLWDRWDTSEWAVRVRDYVNNESLNAEYIPEWDTNESLTTEEAWAREACVADEKYIFFSRDLY
ncbi:MAG TPA: hypothetical protein VK358_14530 [Longimicrobium sp.]|nr:hypothetical protein [Longimicrobium sp.]